MKCAPLFCALALGATAEVSIHETDFAPGPSGQPAGWETWAPRPEIAPRTFVDTVRYRSNPGSLAVSGHSNPAEFGGWVRVVPGVVPGSWYRFTGWYRAEGLSYDRLQLLPRLDWVRADGKRAGQPDYVYATKREGDWKQVTLDAPAPQGATAVKLQLFLQNAPSATVWWDDIAFEQIPAPSARSVNVVSVNHRPQKTASAEESVSSFLRVVDETVQGKADVIVLPEGITVVGTGKKYPEVAEPIPGPTTVRLGEMAKKKAAYIAAGLYEREGAALYNTAVLLDRAGHLVGKYRKVYLPREEVEGGLTPGSDYPVFRTDFGNVGMMICWDVQYADPARALALRGAELILLPIWGGNQTLARARAIENRVFLASSGYDFPTQILDPDGEVLSAAHNPGKVAVATIDLNRRYVDSWLGDMRGRFMKEVRLDLPTVQH
jgi:predicted amidohydrolase